MSVTDQIAEGPETLFPLVSVIYVNYNTSSFLLRSIASIAAHCREVSYEIIIVDNASADADIADLRTGIEAHSVLNIILIENTLNAGFARANNTGSKHARGQYLFFLNPDTLLLNDVLKIFCDFLNGADRRIGACGGNLLNEDLSPNSSYGNFPGILLELCNVGLGLSFLLGRYFREHVDIGSKLYTDEARIVDYIVGAGVFIRSDLFRAVNGFDPGFFMYYEETDLFRRLAEKGYAAQILPSARIVHLEGKAVNRETNRDFNYGKFKLTLESKLYYYRKWYKRSFFLIAILIQLQIYVQHIKGAWGRDLKRLLKIYEGSLRALKRIDDLRP